LEYSTDEITWEKQDIPTRDGTGTILSYDNRNIQYISAVIDGDLEGLIPGFYRWNMVAMISGRCDYRWDKRMRFIETEGEQE